MACFCLLGQCARHVLLAGCFCSCFGVALCRDCTKRRCKRVRQLSAYAVQKQCQYEGV